MNSRQRVILVLLIIMSVLLGAAPTFFRKPLTPGGTIGRTMKATLEAVRAEDWERAAALAERVETEWKRVKTPIAVNSDATAVREFERELATLRAAIELKDKNAAVTAIALMTTIIEDLGTY